MASAAAATGGVSTRRQGGDGWDNFGSIAQQQRTMIHLTPLSRALIGIRRRIGASWSVVFRLGVVFGPLVLGMRVIAVHTD